MNWEQLLSLKRQGDTNKRLRKEQDETRLGFEVDYDRIIFSSAFRSLQDKTQVASLSRVFYQKYKKDMYQYLKSFLSTGEMKKLVKDPVRRLPNYRIG